MNEMKLALFASTGAAEMSVFHQLVGGNSGSGCGSSPPTVASSAAMAKTIGIRTFFTLPPYSLCAGSRREHHFERNVRESN